MHVALVTGAAHGIGRVIAERLAADGFRVLATDPDAAQLEQNAASWSEAGWTISAHVLDCRDRAGVIKLLDDVGRIDVAVNNAGISGTIANIEDLSAEECHRILSVNLLGTFRVAQEAARRMKSGGRIINIASRACLGAAEVAHYSAAKAGVVALTRAMAVELRWKGITVNVVAPGLVGTRALDFFSDEQRAELSRMEINGEPADPSVISDVVSFLASPAARYMSGQLLHLDGGKTVGVPGL